MKTEEKKQVWLCPPVVFLMTQWVMCSVRVTESTFLHNVVSPQLTSLTHSFTDTSAVHTEGEQNWSTALSNSTQHYQDSEDWTQTCFCFYRNQNHLFCPPVGKVVYCFTLRRSGGLETKCRLTTTLKLKTFEFYSVFLFYCRGLFFTQRRYVRIYD